MLTPRENMIRTLRCEEAEWMPVAVYADPFNHPDPATLPPHLARLFQEKVADWGRGWELIPPLSEYMGVTDYIFQMEPPYRIAETGGVTTSTRQEGDRRIQLIRTPVGELTQVSEGGFTRKHFVTRPEDLAPFRAYVDSWSLEPDPMRLARVRQAKELIGENGMIWSGHPGTPLGMMYRFYADIAGLIYMIADLPDEVEDLFAAMERKYAIMYRFTLENCPEIDAYLGMDDTSTSIVSPVMFRKHNVALTDARAEMVHRYGKFYMHHSCGLIHGLLSIYRKTAIDAVHAFTAPPLGDVTLTEGRALLGDRISMYTGIASGLNFPKPDELEKMVAENCEDARRARHVICSIGTPDSRHGIDFMQRALEVARRYQKL